MNEILRRHAFSITFLVVLFGYLLLAGGGNSEIQRFVGVTMGTGYNVQVVELPQSRTAEQVAAEVDALLSRLDREIFSTYAPQSELSRFNRHGVEVPFIASSEFLEVMQLALTVAEQTAGAFDVTVGPLVNLWGFGPEPGPPPGELPRQSEIDAALERVDYRALEIDRSASRIRKTRDVYVDLSAVAKGYAVDKLGEYFDSLGVGGYFLEIGGELKMKGLKADGGSWIPAIESPDAGQPRIHEIFFSRGEAIAVAGSGDYRNYFEQDSIRYSHEIDPRTGRPIDHNLAAAYVIDDSAAHADALSTAFMIMGLEESSQFAMAAGQAVYLIHREADGTFAQFISPEFQRFLNE